MVSNSIDVYERVRLKVVTYRGVCLIIAAFKSLISFFENAYYNYIFQQLSHLRQFFFLHPCHGARFTSYF